MCATPAAARATVAGVPPACCFFAFFAISRLVSLSAGAPAGRVS
ncbi:hypothetical protein GCM10010512_07280 [Streptomyces thermoviolaceus subsp. thermoviolaceus]|nr:hypothetical protein GCM10010499_04330 [Streptomyces thermoviolaceus subsp. apingens]GHA78891.1 hypothetical protein GCM10010512_07280 [Streptomyces thermoviolaceus subsp. thermoviolaceus]